MRAMNQEPLCLQSLSAKDVSRFRVFFYKLAQTRMSKTGRDEMLMSWPG